MRVLIINGVCGIGSTGKLCCEIAEKLEKEGNIVKIAYGRNKYVPEEYQKYAVRIGNAYDVYMHALNARLFDSAGFGSKRATSIFLKWVDGFEPDLIWLHNLHGYYINVEMLFQWIKERNNIKIKWTLHDCWAFTGHCTHYMTIGCEKWKNNAKVKCQSCPLKHDYPCSIFKDSSLENFERKKETFCGVDNLNIIVPSEWLKKQIQESFLNKYPVEVKKNEIDRRIFKFTVSSNPIIKQLKEKKIILGVASIWSKKKGLRDFINLSEFIYDKEEEYVVLL